MVNREIRYIKLTMKLRNFELLLNDKEDYFRDGMYSLFK